MPNQRMPASLSDALKTQFGGQPQQESPGLMEQLAQLVGFGQSAGQPPQAAPPTPPASAGAGGVPISPNLAMALKGQFK